MDFIEIPQDITTTTNNTLQWMLPAYFYCLVFALIFLFGLIGISLAFKAKTRAITEKMSTFFIKYRTLAIIFAGVLLALPLGMLYSCVYDISRYYISEDILVYAILGLMVVFLLCLVIRRLRELLLSPFRIKWSMIIFVSLVGATILFSILSTYKLLPGADIVFVPEDYPSFHSSLKFHPYDSMLQIYLMPYVLILEIPIAVSFYWIGACIRFIWKKIKARYYRKKNTM